MTDINDKQYHHNLHRSFSDGIPRWQNVNKEFQFYTGKENVNILGSHRFHRLSLCIASFSSDDDIRLLVGLLYKSSIRKSFACVSVVDSNCSFPSDDIRPLISWNFLPVWNRWLPKMLTFCLYDNTLIDLYSV
jgi:hypothetical protein